MLGESSGVRSAAASLLVVTFLLGGASDAVQSGDLSQPDPPFGPNVRVDDDVRDCDQGEPSLAMHDGVILVAYMDDVSCSGDMFGIRWTRSMDGGSTWEPSRRLDDTTGLPVQGDPSLVFDANGTAYLGWISADPPRLGWVMVARSDDGGLTWTRGVRVSPDTGFNDREWLAVGPAGEVYITWHDKTTMWASASFDHALTWEPPVPVNESLGEYHTRPAIGVSGTGVVCVGWVDSRYEKVPHFDVAVSCSRDRAGTWSRDVILTPGPERGEVPVLAGGPGDTLYAVWVDTNASLLRFSTTRDGGSTWSSSVPLSAESADTEYQSFPWMWADRHGLVYVSWLEKRGTFTGMRFTYSLDSGRTFARSLSVSDADHGYGGWTGDFYGVAGDANGTACPVWGDDRNSHQSDIYSACAPIVRTVSGPPDALRAEGGPGIVTLSWEPPSVSGFLPLTGYAVERRQDASGASWERMVRVGNLTAYVDGDVVNGTAYIYRVRTINPYGTSVPSNEARGVPHGPKVPGPPRGLRADAVQGYIALSWSPPESDGGWPVTAYSILRAVNTTPPEHAGDVPANAPLTWSDLDVTPGVKYYYYVSAVNAVGEGPRAGPVNATVPPTGRGPPEDSRDTPGGGNDAEVFPGSTVAWTLLVAIAAVVVVCLFMRRRGRQRAPGMPVNGSRYQ